MDGDILRITSERRNIIPHPFEGQSLISERRIVFGQSAGLCKTKDTKTIVKTDVNDWRAAVHRFNDQTTWLSGQFVFGANEKTAA